MPALRPPPSRARLHSVRPPAPLAPRLHHRAGGFRTCSVSLLSKLGTVSTPSLAVGAAASPLRPLGDLGQGPAAGGRAAGPHSARHAPGALCALPALNPSAGRWAGGGPAVAFGAMLCLPAAQWHPAAGVAVCCAECFSDPLFAKCLLFGTFRTSRRLFVICSTRGHRGRACSIRGPWSLSGFWRPMVDLAPVLRSGPFGSAGEF